MRSLSSAILGTSILTTKRVLHHCGQWSHRGGMLYIKKAGAICMTSKYPQGNFIKIERLREPNPIESSRHLSMEVLPRGSAPFMQSQCVLGRQKHGQLSVVKPIFLCIACNCAFDSSSACPDSICESSGFLCFLCNPSMKPIIRVSKSTTESSLLNKPLK